MKEIIEKNRIARKKNAKVGESLLANLPLLVCGLVMTLAIGLEWLG